VLLLEDLAPAQDASLSRACSPEAARLAIREIAKLHAAWWDNPRLDELAWLPKLDAKHYRRVQDEIREKWPALVAKVGDQCPPGLLAIGAALQEQLARVCSTLGEQPRTVIHYDFHIANMLFQAKGGTVPLAVIDWECTMQGRAAHDVARLFGSNLDEDVRRAEEMDLLAEYHGKLRAGGVENYSFEACFADYRRSLLDCLARAIIAVGGAAIHPLRTRKLLRYWVAIEDLAGQDLLL
jgi:aminoglycoside/choline kinase family phosphotransferase